MASAESYITPPETWFSGQTKEVIPRGNSDNQGQAISTQII